MFLYPRSAYLSSFPPPLLSLSPLVIQLGVKEEQEAVVRRELHRREIILKDKVHLLITFSEEKQLYYNYIHVLKWKEFRLYVQSMHLLHIFVDF